MDQHEFGVNNRDGRFCVRCGVSEKMCQALVNVCEPTIPTITDYTRGYAAGMRDAADQIAQTETKDIDDLADDLHKQADRLEQKDSGPSVHS